MVRIIQGLRKRYEDILQMLPLGWDADKMIWQDKHSAYGITNVVTQNDYGIEGKMLAHCLGTKRAEHFNGAHRVFSIRDPEGVPHATILTTRNPQESPYGMCRDLATGMPMYLDDEKLWVLQVRGRDDALAMLDFHRIARRWYIDYGGILRVGERNLDDLVRSNRPDRDEAYHFEYKYDPAPSRKWNWTWEDEEKYEKAKAEGLVH